MSLLLRLPGIGARSLWFDEAFSYAVVSLDTRSALVAAINDHSPPLYYLLLQAWIFLGGDGIVWMRLLSVLFSILSVWIAYGLAHDVCSEGRDRQFAAVACALAVAGNAYQISIGNELRMYSLFSALALASTWCAVRLWQRPGPRSALTYAACCAALLYTHYLGALTVMAHGFAVGLLALRSEQPPFSTSQKVCTFVGSWSIALVLFSPWIPVFVLQAARVRESFWVPPVSIASLASVATQMFVSPGLGAPTRARDEILVTGGVLLSLAIISWRGGLARAWIVTGATVPVVGALLASLLGTHVFMYRYLSGAQTFVVLAVAIALVRVFPAWLGMTILAAAQGLATIDNLHATRAWNANDGVAGLIAAVEGDLEPGAVVLCDAPQVYLPAKYYLRTTSAQVRLLYGPPIPRFHGSAILSHRDLVPLNRLEEHVVGPGSVWLLSAGAAGNAWHLPQRWIPVLRRSAPDDVAVKWVVSITRYDVAGDAG